MSAPEITSWGGLMPGLGRKRAKAEAVRTAASWPGLLQSCRSPFVKSFGRRRRTKVFEERARGPRAMFMGILFFGWSGTRLCGRPRRSET